RQRILDWHRPAVVLAAVLVGALVPDDHGPCAVLALRDDALELRVVEGMFLGRGREPLVARVHGRALGDRPGLQDVANLETEVVVKARGRVLLDDEPRSLRA